MRYGYIRVSSKDQNVARQISAMEQIGLDSSQLFIDWSSGKDFERSSYIRLVEKVNKGDEIVIKSIDRLGRNYDEILEQWRILVKEKGVEIEVLDFPLLNTKNGSDNLTGRLVSDLILQILSYVSQLEREQIRQRQREGIREAKRRGITFGRPRKTKPEQFQKVYKLWKDNNLTLRQASILLSIPKSTLYNWFQEEKNCPKR